VNPEILPKFLGNAYKPLFKLSELMDFINLVVKEALRRGYSLKTIRTYVQCLKQFFRVCLKDPKSVTKNDITSYTDRLVERGATGNTINVHLNAIKFLMEDILGRKVLLNIRYSKTPKRLPTVLTKEEVQKLIRAAENPKHSLILKLMYSSGLRLSELVHLKKEDLELEKNIGWVRKGKGGKDRLFIIAEKLKKELEQHIMINCPSQDSWVFIGCKERYLSQKSVQEIVKKAAKKAGISKNVHPHTLRHSFATHLIEDGYDIASVQFLLGHNSIQTTMVYVHTGSPKMISVKSPYDGL
jgi:site-specific recombinase XerD